MSVKKPVLVSIIRDNSPLLLTASFQLRFAKTILELGLHNLKVDIYNEDDILIMGAGYSDIHEDLTLETFRRNHLLNNYHYALNEFYAELQCDDEPDYGQYDDIYPNDYGSDWGDLL